MGLFSRKKDKKTEDKKIGAQPAEIGDKKKKIIAADKPEPKKPSMKELYGGAKIAPVTTGKKADSGSTGGAAERKISSRAYRILIKPLVTEKAANLGAENKYVFAVETRANKIEIAKAITQIYGIKPVSVNIVRVKGKSIRYGRIQGERKDWKKAIVMLPAGKSINIYEGV